MKKIFKYSSIVLAALVAATTAMTAQDRPEPGKGPEGVIFNKTVEKLGANDYVINIETYVTGKTTQTVSEVSQPMDVIFVLDCSGSMKYNMDGTKTGNVPEKEQRMYFLKQAVNNFLTTMANDSKLPQGQYHKASLITFASTGNSKTLRPLQEIKTSNLTDFTSQVNNMTANGGTRANEGMVRAVSEATDETDATRPIYVILFTDGAPGDQGFDNDTGYNTANSTISQSSLLKNMRDNVKVYTIGIFDKNDKQIDNINQYMGLTSSNYPGEYTKGFTQNRRGTWQRDNIGNPVADKYYKITTNSDELKEIFENISKEAISGSASYELTGESTANIDIISSSFRLPDGMEKSDVSLSIAQTNGVDANGVFSFGAPIALPCTIKAKDKDGKEVEKKLSAVVEIDEEKQEVKVTGFNYSDNYVSVIETSKAGSNAEFTGCKLIISFHIEINPENPGGANEPTNTVESGLYVKDKQTGDYKQIAAFQQPQVNNPNLIIEKLGLSKNESAVFTIHDENANMADMKVVATCTEEGKPAYVLIKVQDDGRYKVTEEAWSWAYGAPELSVTKPQTSDVKGGYSITRDVSKVTEDDTTIEGKKGTFFIFSNPAKSGAPQHGEGYKNNVFSGHTEPSSTAK